MVLETHGTCMGNKTKVIIFAFGLSPCDHFKQVKAVILAERIYGRLNLNLVRLYVTAILSRCYVPDY